MIDKEYYFFGKKFLFEEIRDEYCRATLDFCIFYVELSISHDMFYLTCKKFNKSLGGNVWRRLEYLEEELKSIENKMLKECSGLKDILRFIDLQVYK